MSFEKRAGLVLAAYETLALATGKVPPLTHYLRLHPMLGVAATVWVGWHLLAEDHMDVLQIKRAVLMGRIDEALDRRDRVAFLHWARQWRQVKREQGGAKPQARVNLS